MRKATSLKRFRERTVQQASELALDTLSFEGVRESGTTEDAQATPHTILLQDGTIRRYFCVGADRVGDPDVMVM